MLKRRHWFFLLVVIGLIISTGGGALASPPLAGPAPLISISSDGLSVEWNFPDPVFTTNPDGAYRIEIPGFELLNEPGAPLIPVVYQLVALPPGGDPLLVIEQMDQHLIPSPGALELAPLENEIVFDADGNPVGLSTAQGSDQLGDSIQNRSIPTSLSFNNLAPVEFEYMGVMRGVSLGRLVFYPVRPANGSLQITEYLRVSLKFNAPQASLLNRPISNDPLVDQIATMVINPVQVQADYPAVDPMPYNPADINAVSQVAIIPVSQRGMTQITYAALNTASFPVASVNIHNLHLSHAGVEVAMEEDGDGDSLFESGERLLFYADPRPSRWISYDTYVLSETANIRAPMGNQSAAPGSLTTGNAIVESLEEKNLLYEPIDQIGVGKVDLGRDGDRYAWERIQWSGSSVTKTYTFNATSVDNKASSLSIWMIGYTDTAQDPDHRLNVSLNGSPLGMLQWDGKKAKEGVFNVPAGVLVSGNNTLTLNLNGGLPGVTIDGMWLDAFSIRYPLVVSSGLGTISLVFSGDSTPKKYIVQLSSITGLRAYDVTTSSTPKILGGFTTSGTSVTLGDPSGGGTHQYAITADSGILSPSPSIRLRQSLAQPSGGGVNYIIISHASFINSTPLNQLVSLRSSKYSALVQDVQAIYDNFSDGRLDPVAIRNYLANAYSTWTPRPQIALLVGDGTANPKFFVNKPILDPVNNTYIPPFLEAVDPWLGEVASDNQFVAFQGSDNLPEMVIGRLPVNSTTELTTIVNKIATYENTSTGVAWWKKVAIVADDPEAMNDFTTDANQVAAIVPAGFSVTKLYQTSPGSPYTNTSVINTWNAGNHFMVYVGHGAPGYWAKTSDQLFRKADIPSINNGTPTPIVLSLTCSTGKFQEDNGVSLDETMLISPNEGAVAAWSPAGLGFSSGHVLLAKGFLNSAFYQNSPYIGQAAYAGMLNLIAQNGPLDLINTFILLGDPATSLRVNVGTQVFLPFIKR